MPFSLLCPLINVVISSVSVSSLQCFCHLVSVVVILSVLLSSHQCYYHHSIIIIVTIIVIYPSGRVFVNLTSSEHLFHTIIAILLCLDVISLVPTALFHCWDLPQLPPALSLPDTVNPSVDQHLDHPVHTPLCLPLPALEEFATNHRKVA